MNRIDIVVHLRRCGVPSPAATIALALARRLPAHLLGVVSVPFAAAAFASPEAVALHAGESEKLLHEARSHAPWWSQQLAAAGVDGAYDIAQGDSVDALSHASRWADLLVVERPMLNPEAPVGWGVVSRTVFDASAPVLVVPDSTAQTDTGRHVIIGWNGSRESILALRGALPLLRGAESVSVLDGTIDTPAPGIVTLPTFDLRGWLQRRGIDAVFQAFKPERDHGAALLDTARSTGADLIVMGAWGSSRITELVLGGVTRHLFQHSDIPLLVAH